MEEQLKSGKYIIAVSGGVDSMVLLDLLRQQSGVVLVVAHFDHGIRPDSHIDRGLVQKTAAELGLPFVYEEGKLGSKASEDTARKARYEFLHIVREEHKAKAIVTAHHQDDMLETALINMLRGTKRKGLSSLQSTDVVKRPLLHLSKKQITKYAKSHNIQWREDVTNQDTTYLRNHIRQQLIPKLTSSQRQDLIDLLVAAYETNKELDLEIAKYLQITEEEVDRIDKKRFISLPHDIAGEVMATWLRQNGIRDFDQKTIQRLIVAAKTLKPGQRANINKTTYLLIDKPYLRIIALTP